MGGHEARGGTKRGGRRGGAEREKSGWTRKWATLGEEAAGRRARWRVRAGDGGARAHLSGDPSAVSSSSMSSSSSPASPAAGASSSAARSSRPCASSSPISRPTPRSASMASSSSSSSFDVSLSTAGSTVASVDAPTFISASPSASAGLTIIFAARRGQQPKRGHPPPFAARQGASDCAEPGLVGADDRRGMRPSERRPST